jgi:hypothetical protein
MITFITLLASILHRPKVTIHPPFFFTLDSVSCKFIILTYCHLLDLSIMSLIWYHLQPVCSRLSFHLMSKHAQSWLKSLNDWLVLSINFSTILAIIVVENTWCILKTIVLYFFWHSLMANPTYCQFYVHIFPTKHMFFQSTLWMVASLTASSCRPQTCDHENLSRQPRMKRNGVWIIFFG